MMEEIRARIAELPILTASMKEVSLQTVAGATTHSELSGRDNSDQHPISAVTGLHEALNSKLSESELKNAVDSALLQAKESGEFNGADGKDGTNGRDGVDGKDGTNGKNGIDGKDGISPTVSISKSGKVTTITITDATGTHVATINDGTDGSGGGTGSGGADGVGIANVAQTITSAADNGINVITVTLTNGATHTFEVRNGSKGSDGKIPVKGTDYFTDTDKNEMIELVLAALPIWLGGSY